MGFTVFGLTGRNDDQKAATVANLTKVGYQPFTGGHVLHQVDGQPAPPSSRRYITCATAQCTTVEYKAGTRKHIERTSATTSCSTSATSGPTCRAGTPTACSSCRTRRTTCRARPARPPRPTLAPRTHFTMEPDGSSGQTAARRGHPEHRLGEVDHPHLLRRPGTGIADKTPRRYITEMQALTATSGPATSSSACARADRQGTEPAVVFDADDTTLWTYDMEDAAMKFNFDPALQDVWVQESGSRPCPGWRAREGRRQQAGCKVIGLTGRSADQRKATIENLAQVGYTTRSPSKHLLHQVGRRSQQPSYVTCAVADECTTRRVQVADPGLRREEVHGDHIIANFGDQFSDLIGGHAEGRSSCRTRRTTCPERPALSGQGVWAAPCEEL